MALVIRGVDVSAAQGRVDWPAVSAAGIQFAYLEAKIGNNVGTAAAYSANRAAAPAAGLACGAYLFGYPLPTDPAHPDRGPEDQARAFYAAADGLGLAAGDLPPVLDAEWPVQADWPKWGVTAATIRQWFVDAAACVRDLFGVRPLLYTYPDWARTVGLASDPRFAGYGLWYASYPAAFQTTYPGDDVAWPTCAPWPRADVWQFSSTMRVPGIACNVDGDVIRGEDFAALTRGRTTIPPEAA